MKPFPVPKKLSTIYSLLQKAVENLAAKKAKPARENWSYVLDDDGTSAKAQLKTFLSQRELLEGKYFIELAVLEEIVVIQKAKRSEAVRNGNQNRRHPK